MTTTLPVPQPGPSPRRPRRTRRWWVAALVVLLGVVAVPAVSFVGALTYPGDAPLSVRTVEWVRDHGGGGIVDLIENWWYARAPSGAAPDPASLPAAPGPAAGPGLPAPIPVRAGLAALPGEGRWAVRRTGPGGAPVLLTTFERPDAGHPSVVAGVARLDVRATRLQLVAGTTQPDRTAWPEHAQVPVAQRAALVATFNSGFKMGDARGGFLADGRTAVPLRTGAASVVVRRDGSATVGAWGRDAGPGPDVVAVRQNLDLVVDAGRPADGIGGNADLRWGSAKNQLQFTWRSGLGVDAAGDLLYVGGAHMNLTTLADALVQAGAVRGMQLDIHNEMVDFFAYPPGPAVAGVKLLPDMPAGAGRYLVPDQRDFFAVMLK